MRETNTRCHSPGASPDTCKHNQRMKHEDGSGTIGCVLHWKIHLSNGVSKFNPTVRLARVRP